MAVRVIEVAERSKWAKRDWEGVANYFDVWEG